MKVKNLIHEYFCIMGEKSVLLTEQRQKMLAELERNGVKSIKHDEFEDDAVLEKLMYALKENRDANDDMQPAIKRQ